MTAEDIHGLVRAIGCLQLDPTAVVARNHLLVLFSRLGPFDPKLVETLLWDERRLFEYWAHKASIVPIEDRALHMALPPRWGDPNRTEAWMTQRARVKELVLERLAVQGSVRAADFEAHGDKYDAGWGQRSEVTDTIALLWLSGQVVPAGRDGRGRRWALADRWFGEPLAELPDHQTAIREAVVRSLRALGVATQKQVKRHFVRGRYDGLASAWKDLEADGQMVPADLGINGDWYLHVEDIEQLEEIEASRFEPRTTLLSPFDNLICDRDRTLAIWDFDFRLEIYVPRSRRWGYFVMPLLHGDSLIARFDVAADKKNRVLDVIGERWQPGWERRKRPVTAVHAALAELASFVGAEHVRY